MKKKQEIKESRYLITEDEEIDYREESKKMIDAVINNEWLLKLIYRTIKNVTKE